MIKRELKVNFKSFLIWTLILLVMFLVVFLVYPFIVTDETMGSLNDMMKVFPPELLKSFNMDITSIDTAYGWLKSEGFMFVLLITGFYASNLGATILFKEETDKTIEYLHSLPVKRSTILFKKVFVGLIYITSMIVILGVFNYVALLLSGDFKRLEYLLLSVTPLLTSIPLFSLNLFISTLLKKNKKTLGISLGLVFIFYLLNVLGELSEKVKVIKYFSIYTLADIRNVISNTSINGTMVLISIIISLVFIVLSFIKYNKKELV